VGLEETDAGSACPGDLGRWQLSHGWKGIVFAFFPD
jgi:hypothetical protein